MHNNETVTLQQVFLQKSGKDRLICVVKLHVTKTSTGETYYTQVFRLNNKNNILAHSFGSQFAYMDKKKENIFL
jgi:transglutaminase/protease-like cytokinesis protein 3